MNDTNTTDPTTTDGTPPDVTAAPADPSTTPDTTATLPDVGAVVFFEGFVSGETEPGTFVGLVIRSEDERVRVVSLGLAADSADFPGASVRLSA